VRPFHLLHTDSVRAAAAVFLATALAPAARASPPDELFDPLKAIEYDLYDFAPVAYLRLDSRTRIVEANLTAATLFGTECGRLIGRPLSGLVAPEFRPTLLEHVRACLGERIRVSTEIAVAGRRSGNVAVQLTSMPVQADDGAVLACKSTLTDVSELKRAQEVLRFLGQAGAKLASSFDYQSTVSDVIEEAVPILGDVAIADVFDRGGELRRIQVAVADPKHRRLARIASRVSPPRGRGAPVDEVVRSRGALLLTDCDAGTFRDDKGQEGRWSATKK